MEVGMFTLVNCYTMISLKAEIISSNSRRLSKSAIRLSQKSGVERKRGKGKQFQSVMLFKQTQQANSVMVCITVHILLYAATPNKSYENEISRNTCI